MGREARQRKERRSSKLARLAKDSPKLFEQKWNETVNAWASAIWCALRDQVFLTDKDYESFILKYPHAGAILATLLRFAGQGYLLCLDKVDDRQWDELGADAAADLLSRVKQGGLRGKTVFAIADRAQQVLSACGERAVAVHRETTEAVLTNECCRALARHIGHKIYSLNRYRPMEE